MEAMLPEIDDLHMRAFQMALYRLRELGVKPPVDVSEFKVRHRQEMKLLLNYNSMNA